MIKSTITGHVGTVQFTEKEAAGDKPAFSVLSFTVASNGTTRSGQKVTNWATCKLWGPRAKSLHGHLVQGQGVAVTGRPEARGYAGNDGTAKAELVVHVDEFEFLGGKPDKAPESPIAGDDAVEGAEA